MTWKINVNLEYGRLGPDEVPLIPSVSIPCGAPRIMHRRAAYAVERGIDVGALISSPSPSGLPQTADDLRDDVLYQVGALNAFVLAGGGAMRHVKPQGALYGLCGRNEEYARALLEAVAKYDDELVVIVGPGWPRRIAGEYGLTVISEVSIEHDGERATRADPDDVVRRALAVARDGGVTPTLCLPADLPNLLEITHRLRERLAEEDVEIVGLTQALT